MNQNTLLTSLKNKYDKLATSDTKHSRQSQESYYVKSKQQTQQIIPSFKTLITSRCKTQQTIENQPEPSPFISYRRVYQSIDDISERFVPRSEEILEIYDEYQKNYNHVTMLHSTKFMQDQSNAQPIMQSQTKDQSQNHNSTSSCHYANSNLTQADLNFKMKLAIIRFRFQYYRIKIKNKESPVQITFQSPGIQSNNLRSYFSLKVEFPTKFNADFQIASKSIRIFTETGNYFIEEYLFMTLYSQIDFESTVLVTFGYERKRIITKTAKSQSIQDEFVSRRKKQKQCIKTLQPEMRLQNLLNPETLEQIKSERLIKQQRVLLAGRTITEERTIDKKSKLFVKDQIIQYREIERQLKQKSYYRINLQKVWLKSIFTAIFLNQMHYFLQCQREQVKVEARGKLVVWQFKTKSLISVKDFGETHELRTLFKTKLLLNVHCKLIKRYQKTKSKKIIISFMEQIILTLSVLNQHKRWINKIISIQKNYRGMKIKKRLFREKIWRQIKEEFDDIIQEFLQLKGINNNYFDYEEKPHIHLDTVAMFQLLDEFAQKKKKIWQKYIYDTYVVNSPKNRLISLAINFKVPTLFSLPNELEIREIIEKYAIIKKLI